jgi:glycerol-3-phosphate dehydrogenase
MAEDGVDKAVAIAGLKKMDCQTKEITIHGYTKGMNDTSSLFGSDEEKINELIQQDISLNELLDPQFHYKKAHVIWAVRLEMAMTVEDVLARRLRILFLNAQSAMKIAPLVAVLMAKELNHDQQWIDSRVTEFNRLANQYQINSR